MSFINHLKSFLTLSSMDLESWAVRNSKIATSDQLIEGAIIQSLVSHPDDWQCSEPTFPKMQIKKPWYKKQETYHSSYILSNYKKNITLEIKYTYYDDYFDYNHHKFGLHLSGVTVNGIPFDEECATRIRVRHRNLQSKLKKAEEIATKAAEDMKHDQKKWDLAEGLLGMKRNEFGALVPIHQVEEENATAL